MIRYSRDIRDYFDTAFRNYALRDVPASGASAPEVQVARAGGALIEDVLRNRSLLDLPDGPPTYGGAIGARLRVNAGETALEVVAVAAAPPPSGGLAYMTDEALGEVSDTGSAWIDTAVLDVAATDFLASRTYLGVWSADIQTSSTGSGGRARITVAGSDIFINDPMMRPHEVGSPIDYHAMGGLFRHLPGATPVDTEIKLQAARESLSAATLKVRNARLSLVVLGDDDAYSEAAPAQVFGDTTANKTAQTVGTLSFTSGSSGDYLIVVSLNVQMNASSNVYLGVELTDGATTTGELVIRPAITFDQVPTFLLLKLSGVSGGKTVNLKVRQAGTGATLFSVSEVRMAALRLDRFANAQVTSLGSASHGFETTYTTVLDQTFVANSGPHLTLAAWLMGSSSITESAYSEFDDGGTVVNEHIREFGTTVNTWAHPSASHRIATYSAASRSQTIKRKTESGGGDVRVPAKAVIASLELTGLS